MNCSTQHLLIFQNLLLIKNSSPNSRLHKEFRAYWAPPAPSSRLTHLPLCRACISLNKVNGGLFVVCGCLVLDRVCELLRRRCWMHVSAPSASIPDCALLILSGVFSIGVLPIFSWSCLNCSICRLRK